MQYDESTVQAQMLGLAAMVTNAVRSIWDQGILMQQPQLFEAARAPIHFVQDQGQIGQIVSQYGFVVYTIQAQNEVLQAQFPPFYYLAVQPAYAKQIFEYVYRTQQEAVVKLDALYQKVMEEVKKQHGSTP